MAVTRYADVLAILDDTSGAWRHAVAPAAVPPGARRYVPDSSWMLDNVPREPLLGSLRRLNRGYSPATREFARQLTSLLLTRLLEKAPPWNLARVIDEVTVRVAIEHVLRAPPLLEHVTRLRELAVRRRADRLAGTGPHPLGYFSAASRQELKAIFRDLDERHAELPDGHARDLVRSRRAGELDLGQMASSLFRLFVVHEKLSAVAASLLALLVEHDLQGYTWRIRENPVLVGRLLDEGFRRGLSFPVSMMTSLREVRLSGVTLPEGTPVLVSFAAANVDPERFGTDADAFDPSRPRLSPHLAFSRGAHRCRGACVAEQFTEDVLYALLGGLPDVQLGHDGLILREVTGVSWTVPRLLVEPRGDRTGGPRRHHAAWTRHAIDETLTLVARIELGNDDPGIRGLLSYRPETAGPLRGLCEFLLRGDNTLSRGERELIAAYVSRLNGCDFCGKSHGACAAAQLPGGAAQVEQVLADPDSAPLMSGKLRALLGIARLVQAGGRAVTDEAVAKARAEGATDVEIHDTVLIAAAFCMLNRYVDGLAAPTPDDPAQYAAMGDYLARHGYQGPGYRQG